MRESGPLMSGKGNVADPQDSWGEKEKLPHLNRYRSQEKASEEIEILMEKRNLCTRWRSQVEHGVLEVTARTIMPQLLRLPESSLLLLLLVRGSTSQCRTTF